MNYDDYKQGYDKGFIDGQFSVYKAGVARINEHDGMLSIEFDPKDSQFVLITRELLESMIKSLNESNGKNSRAAD